MVASPLVNGLYGVYYDELTSTYRADVNFFDGAIFTSPSWESAFMAAHAHDLVCRHYGFADEAFLNNHPSPVPSWMEDFIFAPQAAAPVSKPPPPKPPLALGKPTNAKELLARQQKSSGAAAAPSKPAKKHNCSRCRDSRKGCSACTGRPTPGHEKHFSVDCDVRDPNGYKYWLLVQAKNRNLPRCESCVHDKSICGLPWSGSKCVRRTVDRWPRKPSKEERLAFLSGGN